MKASKHWGWFGRGFGRGLGRGFGRGLGEIKRGNPWDASLEQCSLDLGYCSPSTPLGKVRLVVIIGLGIAKILAYGLSQYLAHWG